jgi:hypothetical protein
MPQTTPPTADQLIAQYSTLVGERAAAQNQVKRLQPYIDRVAAIDAQLATLKTQIAATLAPVTPAQ